MKLVRNKVYRNFLLGSKILCYITAIIIVINAIGFATHQYLVVAIMLFLVCVIIFKTVENILQGTYTIEFTDTEVKEKVLPMLKTFAYKNGQYITTENMIDVLMKTNYLERVQVGDIER